MTAKETIYETPSVDIYDIISEGLLCSSNEVLNEEDGNGEFN
jgi:hypothetical protein